MGTAEVTFRRAIPTFPVADVSTTLDYYVGILGFSLGGREADTFASVFRGPEAAANLYFRVSEAVTPAAAYIWVDSVDRLHEEYAASGAAIVEGPVDRVWGYRELIVRDPDGHELVFFNFLDEEEHAAQHSAR